MFLQVKCAVLKIPWPLMLQVARKAAAHAFIIFIFRMDLNPYELYTQTYTQKYTRLKTENSKKY